MKVYGPPSKQPKLGRSYEELSDEERPIYDQFSNPEFVAKLMKFLSLEENKGKDKFKAKHFVLFKVSSTFLADLVKIH